MSKATRQKHRIWLIVAFVIVIYGASQYQPQHTVTAPATETQIAELFEQKRSDVQLEASGEVVRLLQDDNKGSRHQRFIIEMNDGHSLLIAHNIDLAPRIPNLETGDEVTVYGEYEWNDKGGVMHWTHHDPDNRHPHGWIRHKGQLYQ